MGRGWQGDLCGFDFCTVGWLVDCFGFNSPLRQYFSLNRTVSQREGEREGKDRLE